MSNYLTKPLELTAKWAEQYTHLSNRTMAAAIDNIKAAQISFNGTLLYFNEFLIPFWIAFNSFNSVESQKILKTSPLETLHDYYNLLLFNLQVAQKGFTSSHNAMRHYHARQLDRTSQALMNMLLMRNGKDVADLAAHEANLLDQVVNKYPAAIREIEPEYGFHFDDGGYELTAETDRFWLYRVLPRPEAKAAGKIEYKKKPILILPPYVLGANILSFLPREGKSYVHAFADQGVPTYIRIIKDIACTPAVQTMSGEDDALDTQTFCKLLKQKHKRPVTLNGFCQGGFVAMLNMLSGKLDDLVDALITCVAPMDGTRSQSLVEYLQHLPARFRDLGYAVKKLESGNGVVDGLVMSWVYKLKSMEREAPLFTFYRDLMMFDRSNGHSVKISKTAAAINNWLLYDRSDLPRSITQMSFDSYTQPVAPDGTLPVKLFGRKLNFKRLTQKKIKVLICYADKDDLVNKEAAIAPLDYIDAEVTVFPKGHGAIATSWSQPTSECALHTCFGSKPNGGCHRGPVRFQLDLE